MVSILLLGASGNVGQHIAMALLDDAINPGNKNKVTILVREKRKLQSLVAAELLAKAAVVQGDIMDAAVLRGVMEDRQVLINAAGNAHDPKHFQELFKVVTEAAERYLALPKKVWMMSGCTALHVPGRPNTSINSLPIFKHLRFRVHDKNLELLKSTQLDWTLMCPGILHERDEDLPRQRVRRIIEEAELLGGNVCRSRWCPKILISILSLLSTSRYKVTPEDVAFFMVDNVESDFRFSGKRVSLVHA